MRFVISKVKLEEIAAMLFFAPTKPLSQSTAYDTRMTTFPICF